MIIKNGQIADPATEKMFSADLRIRDGLICEIGTALSPSDGEEVTDAKGMVIAPGLIDTHVHFRDPGFTYKEDLHTGSLAAARGGFTSVVCMANTSPVTDNLSVLNDILSRAAAEKIHIYQAAAVSRSLKGEEQTDMEALARAGARDLQTTAYRFATLPFYIRQWRKLTAWMSLSVSMKKIPPSLKITESITGRFLTSWASTVLLP